MGVEAAPMPQRSIIFLLLVLYVVQAVPMGISSALPLSLQGRGATYTDLAKFAFSSIPFTLKLIWAPLVDTTNLPGYGRRKSWLVPVQLICAALMVIPSKFHLPSRWAGEIQDAPMCIGPLTIYFLVLYILMATQDIAVDGWALEILPEKHKKHASTCNTIGQSLGFYSTNILFLLFNHSKDITVHNPLLDAVKHINISLDMFLEFWGVVIGLVTIYVALFVPEHVHNNHQELEQELSESVELKGLKSSYVSLGGMIRLAPVQLACIILLLCRLPFGPVDSSASLKMLETGCQKEILALIAPLAFPVGIASSYLTGRWINKRFSALTAFKYGYVIRLAMSILWLGIYRFSKQHHGSGVAVYTAVLIGILLHTICTEIMFVSQMAFFAQVSDVSMGGTYMTFFNTIANLGNKWPSLLSLALMDHAPLLFTEKFVELTIAGLMIGMVFAWPIGDQALTRLEQFQAVDWHLPTRRILTEDSVELMNVSEHGELRQTASARQKSSSMIAQKLVA